MINLKVMGVVIWLAICMPILLAYVTDWISRR